MVLLTPRSASPSNSRRNFRAFPLLMRAIRRDRHTQRMWEHDSHQEDRSHFAMQTMRWLPAGWLLLVRLLRNMILWRLVLKSQSFHVPDFFGDVGLLRVKGCRSIAIHPIFHMPGAVVWASSESFTKL